MYDGNYSSYHSGGPASGTSRDSSNEFIRLSQVVANNIQKITQNVSQIQRLVGQLGSGQDNAALRDKLHQVQHYTNQLAKETNKYMQDLAHLPQPTIQSEQKQRKMQKERLMNELTTSLNNFQSAQRKAAEKEKESLARARASSASHYDPFMDDRKSDDQLVGVDTPGQIMVQVEDDVDMQALREREQAIHQLESDIMDVNEIFKDLGMLVHEQGEVIDSIESQVEDAQVHVSHGTEELQKAKQYQSKARRKKCCIILIILIVLAIIAIILGVTLSNK
eukprot:GHVU01105878.1.p1 GENE.GHVU01105878.1~~GHVU01105878.1.p1  ORF type:complete len:278 (+),score=34.83 GHVU01105878.1:220-1053(+)